MTDLRDEIISCVLDIEQSNMEADEAADLILAIPEIAEALAMLAETRDRQAADFARAESMGWIKRVDELPK